MGNVFFFYPEILNLVENISDAKTKLPIVRILLYN